MDLRSHLRDAQFFTTEQPGVANTKRLAERDARIHRLLP